MLLPLLEVESDGGMVGEGGQGTFRRLINLLIFFASCAELGDFLGDYAFGINDVKVRVLGATNGGIEVLLVTGY